MATGPQPRAGCSAILDYDKKKDDAIAEAEVELDPVGGQFERLALNGTKAFSDADVRIDFQYTLDRPVAKPRAWPIWQNM